MSLNEITGDDIEMTLDQLSPSSKRVATRYLKAAALDNMRVAEGYDEMRDRALVEHGPRRKKQRPQTGPRLMDDPAFVRATKEVKSKKMKVTVFGDVGISMEAMEYLNGSVGVALRFSPRWFMGALKKQTPSSDDSWNFISNPKRYYWLRKSDRMDLRGRDRKWPVVSNIGQALNETAKYLKKLKRPKDAP